MKKSLLISVLLSNLVLMLSGCGAKIPELPPLPSLPKPPANSPDISGNWKVYLCNVGLSCDPSLAGYVGTLNLFITQEPPIFDSFENKWSSVLDGTTTEGTVVGTCVVGSFLSGSSLQWTDSYPHTPASILIEAATDTGGAIFSMQSFDFTRPGLWQASSACGSGLTDLSGTFQMVKQ